MLITEIYKKYRVTPQLQEHHLRVAAVAKQICDNLSVNIDKETIIKACLIHDLGNILKFDLTRFPEFLEPEGLEYWEKVKADVVSKYGTGDEHEVTMKMAKEIGVSVDVIDCVDHFGFSQAIDNQRRPLKNQICAYADMRVGPHAVVSLEQRLEDGRKRYQNHKYSKAMNSEELALALKNIEEQIFSKATIKPTDITNETIAPIIKELQAYEF